MRGQDSLSWSPARAEGKGRARRAGPACRPVRERGRRLGRAGENFWAGGGVWAAGKEGKERKREVGWAKNDREGEMFFFSTKRFKQFNSNLNSREFKFRLDNKH